ncbi:Flp pilus assembly protein CpaB [Gordonibacter sp. An230]|uniref:Flp pilus assembly protein CpaB n=1 Tax=Gordonibacter sp. An230 TaxID=1965592 RepID=UPI000B3653C9|nr:Flp pilus assembly protein CpaB [Gordonibacter sp. An230]OUO92118.1 Flp pilus assembly protein CpaB [Gordonibacter sp. An230]
MIEARTNGVSPRPGGFAARAARGADHRVARQGEMPTSKGAPIPPPTAPAATTGSAPPDPLLFAKGPQDVRRAKRLALAAALSAAVAVAAVGYGAWAVVSANAQVDAVKADLAPTLVAATNIAAGDTVSLDQLEVVEVPRSFRVEGALGADAREGVVGGRAAVDIPSGAQIAPGLIAGIAGGDHLAAALEAGMEAVTVSVDTETGVAGQIRAFDTVRVIAVEPAASGESVLTTVCERALVVSAGSGQGELAVSGGSVTIAVSPEEADAVREAQYAGRVSFSLVALADAVGEGGERG